MEALGIDLAVRSGAVVQVEMNPTCITSIKVLWEQHRSKREREDVTPTFLAQRGQNLMAALRSAELGREDLGPLPVGIDWGLHEANWGSRGPGLQKAFLAGYLYRCLLERGDLPVFIPPSEVRNFVGLKRNQTKDDVHLSFRSYLHPSLQYETYSEHVVDAALLGLVAYWTLHEGQPWTSRTHA